MKIDLSTIEGYADMTPEEKIKAIESLDVPDPDYSDYVKKDLFDKTASELADKKRELRDKLSEDEAVKLKEAEERQALQENYDKLLHKVNVSDNKAKLLALGYDEKLAEETAEAMASGELEKVFINQKKHMDSFEKKIRAEVLKDTPKPTGDGKSETMTLKKLRGMTPAERLEYAETNPESYKELYGGN